VISPHDNSQRYSRNILVEEIGAAGQEKLSAASVLVVGAGGLGSPALFYLAAAGIGRLGVVDGDRVDATNLNRQILHPAGRVGAWKTASATETLVAFRPDLKVDAYPKLLTADNACDLFGRYDAVVDGTDNFPAKYLCNDAAVATGTPLVHAGVLRFGGQLLAIVPGKGPCLRCLLPDLPSVEDSVGSARVGIVGAAAGILGAWQAMEALKLIAGAGEPLCGRLLTIDALNGTAHVTPVPRDPECPACGAAPRYRAPLSSSDYIQEGTAAACP
jgi:molybdopterin/thiamine biosynthesis adenylyltransferase